MRYKNNVLQKLVHTDALVNKLNIEVNRNMGQEKLLESVEQLRESIDTIREMIAIEPDDFENQFASR